MNGRKFIEEIRQSIEADRGRRTWEDTIRGVSLISTLIFTSSSHFVMEIIQNAEDAGIGQNENGEMEIRFSQKRVLITHNARPFSKDDVDAICGLRTTKKPELGSIGYLGIGSKSVFKITDSPAIFSGDFQFTFDKSAWEYPDENPWQIIPLPVDNLPESIDPNRTIYYLPFRDERAYEEIKNELKNLGLHLYLFLKWLKKITIVDEESNEATTLENLGEEDRIVTLARNGERERYLMLRRVCDVPSYIAEDEITRSAKRSNVKQREITVAFKVDEDENLIPITTAEAYGGVYSFLPLTEERSGANFLIQADFIVVPGRESITYEAAWNHWLIEQTTELVKEAIEKFKQDTVWREQYLSLFEFKTYYGQNSFDKLFNPKLHQPISEYLEKEECIPTYNRGYTNLEGAVVVPKDYTDLLSNKDLKIVFPNKKNPRMISDRINLGPLSIKIDGIGNWDIAKNKDLLQEKAKMPNAIGWFQELYSRIYNRAKSYASGPSYLWNRGYMQNICVPTENLEIKHSDEVYFKNLPGEVLELDRKYPEVSNVLSSVSFLHPELERNLSEFFEAYLKVKKLDYSKICEETFLPKICIGETPPSKEELIAYTRLLRRSDIYISGDIWVLTKDNNIKPCTEVFFGEEYSPKQNWEKNKRNIPGIEFLSEEYIEDSKNVEVINEWKRFFAKIGVKEQGSNAHVDIFGVNFTKEKLLSKSAEEKLGYYFKEFISKEKENIGYDLVGKITTGEEKYLEIKSRTSAGDIEPTSNETGKAETYKDNYLLCIVDGIPENPELYVIPDPVKHGRKERVTISETVWRGFKL